MIEEMRDHYSVTELCEALEVSRAGYYKSKSLPLTLINSISNPVAEWRCL